MGGDGSQPPPMSAVAEERGLRGGHTQQKSAYRSAAILFPLPLVCSRESEGAVSGRTRQRLARARHLCSATNVTIRRLNALNDGRISDWPASAARMRPDRPETAAPPITIELRTAPAVVRRIVDRCAVLTRCGARERAGQTCGEHTTDLIGDTACKRGGSPTSTPNAASTTTALNGQNAQPPVPLRGGPAAVTAADPERWATRQMACSSLPSFPVDGRSATASTAVHCVGGPNPNPVPVRTVAAAVSLKTAPNPYLSHPTNSLRPLRADRIALPTNPGSVELTAHMDAEHQRRFRDPTHMLLPADTAMPRDTRDGRVGGEQNEYVALVRKCMAAGMWGLHDGVGPPPVVNGVFAVAKDEHADRLIIDARGANLLFRTPDPVALPTPDVVAELHTPANEPMFVGKTDLSDFYHQLRLPAWMTPYFCLPPVRRCDLIGGDDQTPVYPKSLVLPMGWSWSVVAAQLIHEHIIARAGLFRRAVPLSRLGDGAVRLGAARLQVYIDDVIVYGVERVEVERLQDDYMAAIQAAGLTVKHSKTVRPRTTPPVTCVGIEVDGEQMRAGVAAGDLHALIRETRALLQSSQVRAIDVEHVVGCWTWAMSVRRSAMCVFNAVYAFVQDRVRADPTRMAPGRLWRTAQRELAAACDLAPLFAVELNGPVSDLLIATDASSAGYGVAVRSCGSGESARETADSMLSRHGLQLLARARSQHGDGTKQSQAVAAIRALAQRAGSLADRPVGGERGGLAWQSDALPCVVAARDAERLPGREGVSALPPEFRVMTATPDSECAGYRAAYEAVTGFNVTTETRAAAVTWTSVVSGAWAAVVNNAGNREPEHINVKETRVVGYGLNYALRRACALDGRVVVLVDSAVALNALAKGRSSSFPLLRAVRRVSALLLATGVRPFYRFVESEANAADLPSRRCLPRGTTFRWRAGGAGFSVDTDGPDRARTGAGGRAERV